MSRPIVYDIAGIGIGPFNLGLAALAAPISSLECIFFDASPCFSWHPGLMMDFAKLQVPFYADLVTGAEPANPYSYFSYLKRNYRLYQFAIHEDNYITRKSYNAYCKWVAGQLKNLFFGHKVIEVNYLNKPGLYELVVERDDTCTSFYARQLVIGIGSVPSWPQSIQKPSHENIIHSSSYLNTKDKLLQKDTITVVGSGQSAAEIFYDLLQEKTGKFQKLNWITRAIRFHPMETSKLTIEMTSPDYIHHFHSLSPEQKHLTLTGQDFLYKGINQELLSAIYQLLYDQLDEKEKFLIKMNCELTGIEEAEHGLHLQFFHKELQRPFYLNSNAVILATGYKPATADFLNPIKNRIQYDDVGRYIVNLNYSIDYDGNEIFVQNAGLYSHGFNTPDLGMGPYRNAIILNTILGYNYFIVEEQIAFQSFGLEN